MSTNQIICTKAGEVFTDCYRLTNRKYEILTVRAITKNVYSRLFPFQSPYTNKGSYIRLSRFHFHFNPQLAIPLPFQLISHSRVSSSGFDCLRRGIRDSSLGFVCLISLRKSDSALVQIAALQANGWPLQLLSVACLSLAAKMEEPLVPTVLDLQVEGAKFIFEPRTICRMELLVLTTLNWRLRSITPFTFIDFFASKVNSTCAGYLISRATQSILTTISEINFLEFLPSAVSVASILHAANEIPNLSHITPESAVTWCQGLKKERIIGCYQLMQEVVVGQKQRKPPKVLPQHRVMTHTQLDSGDSSTSSSSSSFSNSNKRRKLNSYNDNDHL